MARWLAVPLAIAFALGMLGGVAEVSAQAAKPAEKPAAKDTPRKTEMKHDPVDINSATADELKMVPGVGDAYAKKIVDNRPYARKDDLVKKNVMPQGVYDKLKDHIVARQDTVKPAAGKKDDKKK
jgi:DNA uptake protein ComE-like DNA-binding protein